MMTVICPNGVSVINGVFRGAGGVIFNRMCLIGTFSDHEDSTSKTTMTKRKVITVLGEMLPVTERQAGPSNQKFGVRPYL